MLRFFAFFIISILLQLPLNGQHIYYKKLSPTIVQQFVDSTGRVTIYKKDSLLYHQISYVLRFYPNMLLENIIINKKPTKHIANTRPTFFSIFKMPGRRSYKITFSEFTNSTMDSVLLNNLDFNAQIGLIANQISLIEDLSTGGFFNFVSFYFKKMSANGNNRLVRISEDKTLEVGLGYQLLSLNEECIEKLKIEKWQSVIGYSTYIKYYRNRPMKLDLLQDFINDLPVYVQQNYKN